MTPLADEAERALIRERLDCNMVVEAAAGTGKTTELVRRIVAVLSAGAHVDGVVAVTFTEKAAGELKLRLRAELESARHAATGARRRHLDDAVSRLEEARVSTIHGFCADLLRERPVEAVVDPQFRVMTELESQHLYEEAFSRWLQERLEQPPEGVRRALRRVTTLADDAPSLRLRRAGWVLASWRDFPTPWRREGFERGAEIDSAVAQVHEFARLTRLCAAPEKDNLYRDTATARRVDEDIRRAEAVSQRDYDGIEALLVALSSDRDFTRVRKGYGKFFAKDLARTTVLEAHAALCAALAEFARRADADLAAALHTELLDSVRRYEQLKQRRGVLDFVDLLVRARDMIRGSVAVRTCFQERFTHLFVDEFQDTDPLQAEIILLLAARLESTVNDWRAIDPAPGKLFVVGDPKQSIYRFRRADVGTYLDVTKFLIERGALSVRLTSSFRSVPSLQQAINAAFTPLMNGDPEALQAPYVPLSPVRADVATQPSVVALPVPQPYGKMDITKGAIEASLPDAVAAFVEWLLQKSGWTVTDRDRPDVRVPIAARHICLLFRRFDSFFSGDMTRGYVRCLEARSIPHLLVGGKSFHAREEVETMRAALSAIEWPDDELSVFATLHGSLFAIGDEDLLRWRHRFHGFHPFGTYDTVPADLQPIADALSLLASLHRRRNVRTVAETIGVLLEATRAHAAFALRPSGEQALANVLHIAELARAYEMSGGISFRAFVERLLDEAETAQTAEAPILEEGSDGVRIMTTHRAKGLEFPVVVLADITAKQAGQAARFIDPSRGLCALRLAGWSPADLHDHEEEEARRDEAEGLRVAYVAATRARDLLVVPVVGDQPFTSGWISCLNDALYGPRAGWRSADAAPGCPSFGADATLTRPPELAFEASGVKPGLHTFADAGYGVVWWDPRCLTLNTQPRFGIRQQDLIGKETKAETVAADLQTYHEWFDGRAAAIAAGSQPSLRVATATQRAHDEPGGGENVEVIELETDPARPSGRRFGALVHAVLAVVPLDATAERIAAAAAAQARIVGATDEEIGADAAVATRALAHPLMQRANAALATGKCRRETPVTFHDANRLLVEGVVDLAFQETDGWVVVDFKTDRELEQGLDAYRRQVSLYAAAIRAATGKAARAVLFRI